MPAVNTAEFTLDSKSVPCPKPVRPPCTAPAVPTFKAVPPRVADVPPTPKAY